MFSWSPPLPTQQNGVITSYTLSCSPSPSSLPLSPSHSGSLAVAGFSPNTLYSCSLVASNSQGSRPPDTLSFTTKEDCNETACTISVIIVFFISDAYFQLWLNGSLECSETIVSDPSNTVQYVTEWCSVEPENITSTVLDQLSPTCAECSSDQSFSCTEESPSHVIY